MCSGLDWFVVAVLGDSTISMAGCLYEWRSINGPIIADRYSTTFKGMQMCRALMLANTAILCMCEPWWHRLWCQRCQCDVDSTSCRGCSWLEWRWELEPIAFGGWCDGGCCNARRHSLTASPLKKQVIDVTLSRCLSSRFSAVNSCSLSSPSTIIHNFGRIVAILPSLVMILYLPMPCLIYEWIHLFLFHTFSAVCCRSCCLYLPLNTCYYQWVSFLILIITVLFILCRIALFSIQPH